MVDYNALANAAYDYAKYNYDNPRYRLDVIVECMTIGEIAEDLRKAKVRSVAGALKWARQIGRIQKEVELNQAWGAPGESPY
jgi:hypothetical protein